MIATGDCSYENYCKFIHDRRLKCLCKVQPPSGFDRKEMNRRQRNQNATEKGFVVFYWPPMHPENLPSYHADRRYHLPMHSNSISCKDYSYSCMVSMWEHFIHHLNGTTSEDIEVQAFNPMNRFTNRPRLPIFSELACVEVKQSLLQQKQIQQIQQQIPNQMFMTSSSTLIPAEIAKKATPLYGSPTYSAATSIDEGPSPFHMSNNNHIPKSVEALIDDEDQSVVTTSSDLSVEYHHHHHSIDHQKASKQQQFQQVSSTSSPQSTLNLIHQQTMSTTSPSTLFRL
jgi:hypothetical protein